MKNIFKIREGLLSFLSDESGQGLVEYAIIIAVLALATTFGLQSVGKSTDSSLNELQGSYGESSEIVFQSEGGEQIQKTRMYKYDPIVLPKGESHTNGSPFVGWSLDGESIASEEDIRNAIGSGNDNITLTPIYSDYTYTINSGKVTVTGLSAQGRAKEIITEMPDTFEGYPVTTISTGAFQDNGTIALLSLPDTVTEIQSFAFSNCPNLALTRLPNNLQKIGEKTFWHCANITIDKFPESFVDLGVNSFNQCTQLTLTQLPSGITTIENQVFYKCTGLKLQSLPEGLKKIGKNAFGSCSNIILSSFPDTITEIGEYAFSNCTNLSSAKLPEELIRVEKFAFQNCTNLNLTSLPDNLEFIGASTFLNCENLKLTILPSSLTYIGQNAFENCSNVCVTEVPCQPQYNAFLGTQCPEPTVIEP